MLTFALKPESSELPDFVWPLAWMKEERAGSSWCLQHGSLSILYNTFTTRCLKLDAHKLLFSCWSLKSGAYIPNNVHVVWYCILYCIGQYDHSCIHGLVNTSTPGGGGGQCGGRSLMSPYDPTFYNFFPMIPYFIISSLWSHFLQTVQYLELKSCGSIKTWASCVWESSCYTMMEMVNWFFCTIPPDKTAAPKLYRGKA